MTWLSVSSWILSFLVAEAVADFYVSPSGKDSASGTAADPFATLAQAQKAVQQVNQNLANDLYVYVAAGTYYLDQPLSFTSRDSGSSGHRVVWQAQTTNGGVNLSGGVHLVDWSVYDTNKGIWKATTPAGLKSRHFYIDQKHGQRARREVSRKALTIASNGYKIDSTSSARFLLSTEGIETGEVRGINSFTDRIIPIDHVDGSTLVMAKPAFQNNIIGYDTIQNPAAERGFYVENVLAFLDEPNEYFLDEKAGILYYMPPAGVKPSSQYLVVAKLEQLIIIAGTYDAPVHDITFQNFNYMHTTWNLPSTNLGYADQQTGGYIGLDKTYSVFESSRPFWFQVPGSVQVSAASNIKFTGGSMIAIMGGFGVGNDANAHASGVGLGAKGIEISGMFFTQTGANTITVGGIQADAHHPSDARMVNEKNLITANILKDTAKTITSAAGILIPYNTGTEVSFNDLADLPYSGIAWGYGWGTNDAGGNPVYQKRGLYKYQPVYNTPTTQRDGVIKQNVVQNFGLMHTDLGGIYTLSASPNTSIKGNCIFSGTNTLSGAAYHHDEGSRDYVVGRSVVNVTGNFASGSRAKEWWQPNESDGQTTGNLTAYDVAVAVPGQLQLTSSNAHGDHVYDIINYNSLSKLDSFYANILYQAGIPPAQRASRPVNFNPPKPAS